MKSKLIWIGIVAALAAAGCSGSKVTPSAPTLGSAPAAGGTSTRTAQDATGVLMDGGFEQKYTYWSQCGSGASASIQTSVVHGGTYAAKMGGTTTVPKGDAAVCQSFTIPSSNPSISFWIEESTDLTASSGDYQAGQLTSASGYVRKNLYKETASTSGWVQRTVDLSTFAGQTVVLKFVVHGDGKHGHHIVQYIDDITIGGGGATPTPAPTATPTTGPTATPTAGPTTTPTGPPGDACSQSYVSQGSNDLSNVGAAFFSSVLPNASQICISAWDFSSNLDTALIAAANNGAHVVAIAPYSQDGSNATDITELTNAGVEVRNEYTGTVPPSAPNQSNIHSPMDIHAKFALVDGVAYMDGHNWFNTDVVMKDTTQGDFNTIQNVLTTFATPAPSNGSFTTDKQASLQNEAAYINSQTWGPGTEYDFIVESFNPASSNPAEYNDNVYDAMCAVAKTGAAMHLMFESETGYSANAKAAIQDLLAVDSNAIAHYNSGGHEKLSMKRGASTIWFGSSNSTTTDLFDWGYTLSDADTITALQTYFDGQFNGSTNITPTGGSGTYCQN